MQNQNFSLAVFSTPHLQVFGHVLAVKSNSLEFLQPSCLVMASTGLSNCIFLYPCFYFPHRFLQKNGDIDLDKNENAFDGTMWSQAIWALKMIILVQSDLLRQGSVCVCLCLPASSVLWMALFVSLGVCKGFSPFAPCQLAASVLTVLAGLFILNSYGFVVTKNITWDLLRCAYVLCMHTMFSWSLQRPQIFDTENINKSLHLDMPVRANVFCSYSCPPPF